MKYAVVWQKTAEDALADLWTNAPDRNAVAAATEQVDRLLERDPSTRGESRVEPFRVLFEPPLGIDFEVIEPDRAVRVLRVWRI